MMGTEADVAAPATDEASRLAALRARLAAPMPDDRPWGWLGPLLVTAFGAWLRFNRLRIPRALIFDETYYAKDAWSILQHGVEWNYSPCQQPQRQQLILPGTPPACSRPAAAPAAASTWCSPRWASCSSRSASGCSG